MDTLKPEHSPNRGFSRYSMTKEKIDALKSAEAKTETLIEQFDEFNQNMHVNLKEIQEFLDFKVKHVEPNFDPELLEGIVNNLEFNDKGKVSKEDF